MRRLRLLRALAALLGCLGVLLVLGGTPASAHTALEDATPGPGGEIATGTDVVSLTFGRLKTGTVPKLALTGPDGTAVPVGRPVVVRDSVVCAAVAPLRAGVSTLSYTVTSVDGDHQSSAFQFRVADGAPATAPQSACRGLDLAVPGVGTDGQDTVLGLGRGMAFAVLAGVVLLVAGAGVVALRMLRGPRPAGGRGAPV
ncbi:copper resistance CopC family protein [Streptomyces poriticola]|uniref:copper resistance CopC family protein n=1 Tax=Streptomyces poriticola TaxID=3120506 RepID=UPI002FCE0135